VTDQPAHPPLAELEATGCRTWQLTRQNIAQIDDEIDKDGIYAKGYWQDVDGKLTVVGLRIGVGETRLVARFGDWIARHPDGRWTVHKAPADQPAVKGPVVCEGAHLTRE